LANKIAILVSSENAPGEPLVTLRRARISDTRLLYRWQTSEESRTYARTPEVPTLSEHKKWMEGKLRDARCLMTIIELDGHPCGTLRFDPSTDIEGNEISILLAPEARGRGIGGVALSLGRTMLPTDVLCAVVLAKSTASRRMFEKAGFEIRNEDKDRIYFVSSPKAI
jgi:RimJ/RimL family protein N-acetyltransferase